MTDTEDFETRCRAAGVRTVGVTAPDTHGHLRGERVSIDRFFATTVDSGVDLADAMFVSDGVLSVDIEPARRTEEPRWTTTTPATG